MHARKIAIFIYSLGPGGAERNAVNLAKYLCLNTKARVEFILMKDEPFMCVNGVKTHFLCKNKTKQNQIFKLVQIFSLVKKFKSLCEKESFDTIICFLNRPNYIALLAKSLGLKARVIINECSTPSMIYKGISGFFNKALMYLLYKKANKVLANSTFTCKELKEHFLCSPTFLPNALDLKDIEAKKHKALALFKLKKGAVLSKKQAFKSRLFYTKKDFLLNIGRLDEGKNHMLLIKAYKKSKVELPLIILGDGVLKAKLLDFIKSEGLKDKVFLKGREANVYKYLSKCKAFVCSSNYEGFSNVLVEALACFATTVSTLHKNGAYELYCKNDTRYAYLSPVGDINALAKNIKLASANKRLASKESMLKRAKEFDLCEVGKKLCEIL